MQVQRRSLAVASLHGALHGGQVTSLACNRLSRSCSATTREPKRCCRWPDRQCFTVVGGNLGTGTSNDWPWPAAASAATPRAAWPATWLGQHLVHAGLTAATRIVVQHAGGQRRPVSRGSRYGPRVRAAGG
jgi:hypothetical protein